MSFWSSLVFAQVAAPPIVTLTSLGALVHELISAEVLANDEPPLCQVKFGPRVDADEETTDVVEWDASGIIATHHPYPWDHSTTYPSLAALAKALSSDERTVYRAFLMLGSAHPDIVAALTREPSPENERGLCLHAVSFEVGPVWVNVLDGEPPAFVGWMGLSFSGQGYYYPWEPREVRERAEAHGLLRRAAEACRATWPVEPVQPTADLIAIRRQRAALWLYDDFARPLDWMWFVDET